ATRGTEARTCAVGVDVEAVVALFIGKLGDAIAAELEGALACLSGCNAAVVSAGGNICAVTKLIACANVVAAGCVAIGAGRDEAVEGELVVGASGMAFGLEDNDFVDVAFGDEKTSIGFLVDLADRAGAVSRRCS